MNSSTREFVSLKVKKKDYKKVERQRTYLYDKNDWGSCFQMYTCCERNPLTSAPLFEDPLDRESRCRCESVLLERQESKRWKENEAVENWVFRRNELAAEQQSKNCSAMWWNVTNWCTSHANSPPGSQLWRPNEGCTSLRSAELCSKVLQILNIFFVRSPRGTQLHRRLVQLWRNSPSTKVSRGRFRT